MRKKLLAFEAPNYSQDEMGQAIADWDEYHSCWAPVEPLQGLELIRAKQVTNTVTHLIKIRYRDNVTVRDRIKLGSRYLYITACINKGEDNQELWLYAEERV